GSEQESEYSEEDQRDDDETIEWVDTNEEKEKKDDDDDKIIDLEQTGDEEIDDEFVHGEEHMTNAEVEESGNGDEENIDAAKTDAGNTEEVKDDAKKAELPPTSSSLSVSSGFGDQFLKLSSDTSLIGAIKDTTDAEINSLLDIKIQSEVSHIQSPSVLIIPVSVISKPFVLTPIPETPLVAPVTTLLTPSFVSTIPPVPHQSTTPIPTQPITTDAPTITIVVPESNTLTNVQLRVTKLEKDVFELKKMDHFAEALATLKSQVPIFVEHYLGSKIGNDLQKKPTIDLEQEYEKSASEIRKIKREQAEKQKIPKQDDDDDDDDDDDLSAGPNQCKKIKRRRTKESESFKKPSTTNETSKGKAPSKSSKTGKCAPIKEPVEEPIAEVVMDDAVNTTGEDVIHDDDQPQDTSKPKTYKTSNQDWFKQPPRPPTPNLEWNKRQVILDQPEQQWFNQMVSATKDPLTFNDLIATLIDFSKYVLNRLKIDNLTQDLLLGPAYNLLKGTCTSSIELEYNFQECFNALTDKLEWNNPERDRYPLQGRPGHLTVAADYFFNNDLEFLKTSDLEKTYTTSITKTKAAWYEIVGIEDMTLTLWSTIKHAYDKDAEKGIKHWGKKHNLWYRSQVNKFSKHNVYSTQKILGVKSVSVKKLHGYGHLEKIVVKRADRQLYKFKESDFMDLHLNDIEDMLLLAVQHKLFHLNDSDIVDFIVVLQKLNITTPQKTFPEIKFKELYTPSYKPPGVIYEDLNKQKRVMRADELYKFSNGTLKTIRDELHHRILDFHLGYNDEMSRRKWTATDKRSSELMVELIGKQMWERMIIWNLERLVGAWELEMDYKLITRTI
ncbi:hypothetical protein Tco_0123251, partial [Tanacetum coccineum]